MRSNAFIFLIVLLILSLAVNWIQWKSAKEQSFYRDQENDRFQAEQTRRLSVISQRDSAISTLLNQKDSIVKIHSSIQGGLKRDIISLKAKVKKPCPPQDSVIIYQDSLIADLEGEKRVVYRIDSVAIDSLQKSKKEFFTMWQAEYQQRVKAQNRYDELRSRNFTAGPGIGIDITGRPTVTFGVQYRLISFRIGKRK